MASFKKATFSTKIDKDSPKCPGGRGGHQFRTGVLKNTIWGGYSLKTAKRLLHVPLGRGRVNALLSLAAINEKGIN